MLDRAVDVAPVVMQRAEFVFHAGHDRRQRQSEVRDALGDQQPRENAVALGNEVAESDAAALFPADQNVARQHQVSDVFEADRRFVQRRTEGLGDAFDEPGGRKSLHDFAAHLFLANQIEREKREDLVRRNEIAPLVQHAQPIAIAVVAERDVVLARQHDVVRGIEIFGDWLGIHTAE